MFTAYVANFWSRVSLVQRGYLQVVWTRLLMLTLPIRWHFFLALTHRYTSRIDSNLVVTLSSKPTRFNYLELTLKTILLQTRRPALIKIFIETEHSLALSSKLRKYFKFGVVVIATDLDIGPATKVLPQFLIPSSHKWILWLDDDICYSRKMITSMLETAHKIEMKSFIVCNLADKIVINGGGSIEKYENWEEFREPGVAPITCVPKGVGGVMISRENIPEGILDIETYKRLSKSNDDFWFYCHFVVNKTQVVLNQNVQRIPICWPGSQEEALWRSNVGENINNDCFAGLMTRFPKVLDLLIEHEASKF